MDPQKEPAWTPAGGQQDSAQQREARVGVKVPDPRTAPSRAPPPHSAGAHAFADTDGQFFTSR